MGARLPESCTDSTLHHRLVAAGVERIHQGKVRDTYRLPGHPDVLFLIATDRLSIFDFVLPGLTPDKGAVLTALTVFWLTKALKGVKHHLVAAGADIDAFLPPGAQGDADLHARAMVVRKLDMVPVECVVRGYLTGSGWTAYKKGREICGHALPEGLHDGVKLPTPLFTPTTKAEIGHDEAISAESVRAEYGDWLEKLTLDVYTQLADYAAGHGIILADTKFEFGVGGVLGDEAGTPDSSRFWDRNEWEAAVTQRKSPAGYDKQPVREWGKTVVTPFSIDGAALTGIHNLDTENEAHLAFVHSLVIPQDVLDETTRRYRRIFEILTGVSLETFHKTEMGMR